MTMKTVAVLGAGMMGHALALVHAISGCTVRLTDTDPDTLQRAADRVAGAGDTLVEAGALSAEDRTAALGRIDRHPTLAEAVEGADLVVEAVVEIPEVKREVFAEADRHAPARAILASNASVLDVFPLIPEARRPRSAVVHWYTPPYIIDLVDIVPSPIAEPGVLDTLIALYEGFGKTVLTFDTPAPGYIANRLQAALNLECFRLVDEGMATAEQIDLAIRSGLAARLAVLGHMRKADYAGLEMVRNVLRSKSYHPPEAKGESRILDELIEQGRTGVAAGSGFFDYGDTPAAELFRRRDIKLLKFKAAMAEIDEEASA